VVLTGGEVSDVRGFGPVMAEPGPEPIVLLGDKTADSYLGFILIASARLWIRHFVDRT
jgi:hypothetical protein